jgi:hypothetical protein
MGFKVGSTRKTSASRLNYNNLTSIISGRQPYSLNYLAVAGGGAGGSSNIPAGTGGGGGGGAGGFVPGTLSVTPGTTYTITIGAGGVGATPALNSTRGSNTIIEGFVTAVGGGVGVSYVMYPGNLPLSNGGSGGGAQTDVNQFRIAGSGYGFPSPTQQGYPGGAATPGPAGPSGGAISQGGGGGAGGVGGNATGAPLYIGGAGGAGATWPFTGAILYAGGGAGGAGGSNSGQGGPGGGGPGGNSAGAPVAIGGAGATNSGSGGGGSTGAGPGTPPTTSGGTGGSGIVLLTMPTSDYSGSYTGANVAVSNPASAPGKTVLSFYSSGTYTG